MRETKSQPQHELELLEDPEVQYEGLLSHGLAAGTGIALAVKMEVSDYRTYVLLGDGEENEGASGKPRSAPTNINCFRWLLITGV